LRLFLFVSTFLLSLQLNAQDSKLAQQYFIDGEFEKAAVLFEKLYGGTSNTDYYFNRYIDCLTELEQFDLAEGALKKRIKKNPKQAQLYVTYGKLFERKGRSDLADEQYERAIKKMPGDRFQIVKLANSFINQSQYELAALTYETGSKMLQDDQIFSYNQGDLYRRKGEPDKMIFHYLNSLSGNANRLRSLQTLFQRYLEPEYFEELQGQLYERIQNDQEGTAYIELLSWSFLQQNDYASALQQTKALDRRLEENGGRPYKLATIALQAGDFETAIAGFDYIIQEKGRKSSFYLDAKRDLLQTKRIQITEDYNYSNDDLRSLELEYVTFLDEFGRSRLTADIILQFAEFQALYLNDLDKAIPLLDEMIQYPGLPGGIQANGKIALADYYLIRGEIWEATLLYSQVDKAFAEEQVGQIARYRNARLAYFNGDFQWAQTQFDVLKASTSKFISNDALDLSIFITDNLGLDSTTTALQKFADAEMLTFQNKFQEANEKLDSLRTLFPEHSLFDDVLYLEADILFKKRDYIGSSKKLKEIVEKHPEEIRADNALFKLAKMQETQLNDEESAKKNYEKLFIEYSGSTFAVEARKRFRQMRGDDI